MLSADPQNRLLFTRARKLYLFIFTLVAIAAMVATVGLVASRSRRISVPPVSANGNTNEILFSRTTKAAASQPNSTIPTIDKVCFTRFFRTERLPGLNEPCIFVKDMPSGAETKLVMGTSPELSPNAEEIVFTAGKTAPPGFDDAQNSA